MNTQCLGKKLSYLGACLLGNQSDLMNEKAFPSGSVGSSIVPWFSRVA